MSQTSTIHIRGNLSKQEREILMELLSRSRSVLLATVEGLSDAQAVFHPSSDEWSIAQCTEHLAETETQLYAIVTDQLLQGPAEPERARQVAGKSDIVIRGMRERTQKGKTFESLIPRSHPDLTASVAAFEASRLKTIEFVASTNADLHLHVAPLGAFGDLDGYQWLLAIAVHTERHIAQMEEVKRHPEFPTAEVYKNIGKDDRP